MSIHFFNKWPDAKLTALPREIWSDHTPLLLQVGVCDFGPVPFKFFNSWVQMLGFDALIHSLCSSFVFSGPADRKLAVKLKWIKAGIKTWMATEKKKENELVDSLKAQLNYLDNLADQGGLNETTLQLRAKVIKDWKEIKARKRADFVQKSRMKWALDGDENSRFFHAMVDSNISSNRIHGLMIGEDWVKDPMQIKYHMARFFEQKFDFQPYVKPPFIIPGIKSLSNSQSQGLIVQFSREEVMKLTLGIGATTVSRISLLDTRKISFRRIQGRMTGTSFPGIVGPPTGSIFSIGKQILTEFLRVTL
ncbi:hypothetical protein QVD17_15894 [Tagetes erecta]|uniref:RNA-directed DNA polymerase, eukaryota, reverse transcriptase zinc-binding domain protein n=1 Tax=Tagetes erecta TaxID=13708 RepID=A0AAD8KU04_TARER|nr:hypothetical protein QVD17_15894 [Tagetes erecta]